MGQPGHGALSANKDRRRIGLSPELQLVAASLAWPRDKARSAHLSQLVTPSTDWSKVLLLAERHRVTGLLHNALSAADITPNDPVASALRQRANAITFEELALVNELSRLDALLKGVGVRLTVLKGLSASGQGYQRVGLRQNRDIDILVAPQEVSLAAGALLRAGFKQVEPSEPLDERALAGWMHTHKDLVYLHESRGTIVEVHWRLFDNHEFNKSISADTSVDLRLPTGHCIRALPLEMAFAYMFAHGAQHAWSRLKWLADICAYCSVLGSQRIEELYAEWKNAGLGLAAGSGLVLAHQLAGMDVPAAVLDDLARSWKFRTVRDVALRAIASDEVVELEDQAFGSTIKTLSHYLLRGGAGYWLEQARLDFSEVPKSYSSAWIRRLGPFAKVPLWFYVRVRNQIRRRRAQ
jgi:hypothetical protein